MAPIEATLRDYLYVFISLCQLFFYISTLVYIRDVDTDMKGLFWINFQPNIFCNLESPLLQTLEKKKSRAESY